MDVRSPASQLPTALSTSAGGASSSSSEEGRFVPGTLLGDRYRIVSLLGVGGMGEVYRATDLRLSQQVALKFLPAEVARDPKFLARFNNEVRIARQVSHPNVCRVYDIGEAEGLAYISMEYVDGEDLHSLLRRIGRLPPDKALEIARKLCAGLAAAHDKGVLHRDLKPSNIMIDGRGHVLITDFGLAGVMGSIEGAEVRNGTPAYMAPEQLSGKEVSTQSDIYALGVVLYEMFTGKPPFAASTREELLKLTQQGTAPNPSSIVKDIDPVVESVILRCLTPDPRARPASAFAALAALPGGDPLAEALAAGETPSPEMVAASGQKVGESPGWAIGFLAAIVAGLAIFAVVNQQTELLAKVPFEKPPEALADKARDIAQRLGYPDRGVSTADGFNYRIANLRYLLSHFRDRAGRFLAVSRPPVIGFWYRSSPRSLAPRETPDVLRVSQTDPPLDVPGMLYIRLDTEGRLVGFTAVPPDRDESKGPWPAPDWNVFFSAAGLDPARFARAEPEWTPPVMADVRAAWSGTYPEAPEIPIRIETAAFHGKPVGFTTVLPDVEPGPEGRSAGDLVYLVIELIIILGSFPFARYNLRLGRGDTRAAMRLALFGFAMGFSAWLIGGAHVAGEGEADLFRRALMRSIFQAALLGVMYLSFEPFVRRKWPQTIVSWSRILTGGVRDPLVGRDMVLGVAVGVLLALIEDFGALSYRPLGVPMVRTSSALITLTSGRFAAGEFLFLVVDALFRSLGILFLIFLSRTFLRKQWLAAGVSIVALSGILAANSAYPLIEWPVSFLFFGVMVFALMRFGLLVLSVAMFVVLLTVSFPIGADVGVWYFGTTAFVLIAILALSLYGARMALAGQPLFKDD
ncbi:MAG TPA: serine/threonine-protein kinase [Bryobacteraceae bacterium]|nr:serine/threonine-protein kinase [Bryobacteraceae bacterium]